MSDTAEKKYQDGQKVDLIILRETDLGFVAKINETDEGLLYHSEVFERLEPGQNIPGYIKKIRDDGSIDLILQAFGNFGTDELANKILEALKTVDGFLPVNADSPAEKVYDFFGVSKKKFKMAIGSLYKKRLIEITEDGMKIVTGDPKRHS